MNQAVFALIILAFAGWVLGIIELIGMGIFSRFLFLIGIKIVDERIFFRNESVGVGKVVETETGKIKRMTENEIYMRRKISVFAFEFYTPFPIKAVIQEDVAGTAHLVGRISIGPSIFLAAWLTAWTGGGVMVILKDGLKATGFLAMGWIFTAIMIAISIPIEKRKIKNIVTEINEINAS